MELFLFWAVGFGIVTALAAAARGRNPLAWAIWGAAGGVFGLLAVLVMNRVEPQAAAGPSWPVGQVASPDGPVIEARQGVMIHQHGDGYWVLGQTFHSFEAARQYADAARR